MNTSSPDEDERASSTPEQSAPRVTFVFAGLMLAMLAASLNQTALNPALPTIVGELHGVDRMLWVITAYILASTIMMPVYGKLGDLFGRKPLLLIALTIFVVGSTIGALAGDITWLIVGRAVQGAGGGGLMVLSQATIADVIPARQRGKYLGIMSSVFAVSSVAGPLLGGWFTEGPGWRWVFWINLPLGAVAIAAASVFLRLPRVSGSGRRIDVLGMAVLSVVTTLFVLVATWGGSRYAWSSPLMVALIAGTVAGAVLFVAVERRAAEPVIGLHLFRDRNFDVVTAAGLVMSVALFGVAAYMPTYLQMVAGTSATAAGLLMLPMMGALFLTSTLAGRFVTRTGRYKRIPITGSVFVAAGLVLLSTLGADTPIWVLCCWFAVLGVGFGMSMQLLVLVVQNSFPVEEVGTATAGNNYFRQIGATLGSAVVGSVFATRLAAGLSGTGIDDPDSLAPGAVQALSDALRQPVLEAYNDALVPIYLYIAPLVVLAGVLLCLVVEKPLATTIVRKNDPVSSDPAATAST
ncbi:MDR family MFS transporter [Rhodococcus sp. B50]|uniref:MDR family MFS transporter n=1 Tax=Rhodococcus sp. B50 TaxID=2682847 RepID=UPI001BD4A3CC|nr:MDR family MFS transporter [Rhodococcus sp. B50]MBS9374455.1 Multidrug resistance protein 3 [Rhodococcus sp. B50]